MSAIYRWENLNLNLKNRYDFKKIHFITFDARFDVFSAKIVLSAYSAWTSGFKFLKRILIMSKYFQGHALNDFKQMLSMRLMIFNAC